MPDGVYKVYFNAVSTEHGNHLFAVGWIGSTGFRPILEREGDSPNFLFDIEKTNGNVETKNIPFQLSTDIPQGPRSIFVSVEGIRHQIQVNGLKGGTEGENTPGRWVEIKVSE